MKKILFKIINFAIRFHQKEIYKSYFTKFNLHESFRFNGNDIIFAGSGLIEINENCYIGNGSSISSNNGYMVKIGKNCAISHNVRIYNNSYETDGDFNTLPRKQKYGNVIIGNGVWIGSNVVILPNVTIGDNSIIGANSVVTRDIPKNVIASGIPCKVIREKNVN